MIRHATWDIAMAGGYFVTGFGTTYFGGNRHPGPFRVDAPENAVWERQVPHVKGLFADLQWWGLKPADERIVTDDKRTKDREIQGVVAPPSVAYWALAEPGKQYVLYLRGCQRAVRLKSGSGRFLVREFNPRSGEWNSTGEQEVVEEFKYQPRSTDDVVLVLTAVKSSDGPAIDPRKPLLENGKLEPGDKDRGNGPGQVG
jgi:hypothetical protein